MHLHSLVATVSMASVTLGDAAGDTAAGPTRDVNPQDREESPP
jgi:hypothetical protein